MIEQAGNISLSNAILEDFDLGVDVLDSNEFQQSLDSSLDKPLSPYHHHSPSPVAVSPCDTTAMSYNDTMFPVSSSFVDYETGNTNYYSSASIAISGANTTGASWCNPILGSVNMPQDVMDLNEVASCMMANLPEVPQPTNNSYVMTPTSPHTPMSDIHSPVSMTNRTARSLSPAPSTPSTYYTPPTPSSGAYYIPSPIESSPTPSVLSGVSFNEMNDQALVEMPFHRFKKYLDDPTISDSKKEHLKCLRRRGKNKVAAKNCREKKITMISGLQQEVNQMRATKSRLDIKTRGLEKELERLKQICANAHRRR